MAVSNGSEAKTLTNDEALASQSDTTSPASSTKQEEPPQETDASEPQEVAVQFDTSDYPKGIPLFLITTALVLVLFASNLETTIITTAIPRITQDFQSVDE